MPKWKQNWYYCTTPFCAFTCKYDAYNGVAISNHQRHSSIDFDNCQETATADNNLDHVSLREEIAEAAETASHGDDILTMMNMNDEDGNNVWVPPDDECSEGSSSSYVSDYGDDVPFIPFDEYDATEFNTDEILDEQQNCNGTEKETFAITQSTLIEMLDEYKTQQRTQEKLSTSVTYGIELLSILKCSNVSDALYNNIVEWLYQCNDMEALTNLPKRQ